MRYTKVCLECSKEFTFEAVGTGGNRRQKYCSKECKNKSWARISKDWYIKDRAENPEKYVGLGREQKLMSNYGITLDQYNEILKSQNGVCAICKQTEEYIRYNSLSGKPWLSVDHNHVTNKNRGLLCNQCNRALGMFKDSKDIIESVLEYLDKYRE